MIVGIAFQIGQASGGLVLESIRGEFENLIIGLSQPECAPLDKEDHWSHTDVMARPDCLPEPFHTLAEQFGGVGNLAKAFGVTRRTINRWADGSRKPQGPALILMERLLADENTRRHDDPYSNRLSID